MDIRQEVGVRTRQAPSDGWMVQQPSRHTLHFWQKAQATIALKCKDTWDLYCADGKMRHYCDFLMGLRVKYFSQSTSSLLKALRKQSFWIK